MVSPGLQTPGRHCNQAPSKVQEQFKQILGIGLLSSVGAVRHNLLHRCCRSRHCDRLAFEARFAVLQGMTVIVGTATAHAQSELLIPLACEHCSTPPSWLSPPVPHTHVQERNIRAHVNLASSSKIQDRQRNQDGQACLTQEKGLQLLA